MKRMLVVVLGMTAIAATPQLEARVHFLHGWEGGDAVQLYYDFPDQLVPNDPFGSKPTTEFSPKTVSVIGLPLKSWKIVNAFGKRSLEINVLMKSGLDVSFSSLKVNGTNIGVAPSRVMYLKPQSKYPISYERLQQQPNERLFLAMQIFNDSPETVIIEKIIYAPKTVSSDKVLISPKYDSSFFGQLERWVAGDSKTLPSGSSIMNANKLNLKILPSRGFAAALIAESLTKSFTCTSNNRPRDPKKRYDTFIAQPLIQYRIGTGKPALYPIPDQIIDDICP